MRSRRWLIPMVLCLVMGSSAPVHPFPISSYAWDDTEWAARCQPVRTSYNPDRPLSTASLTLSPTDERFVDFLYWVWANKIGEHQVEQVGGTEWKGPTNGVIFHWAPGSRWETHTIVPFEHAIDHLVDEHRWTDRMFPDFFTPFGKIQGVGIEKRLSMKNSPTWAMFLEHIGGPESPYYRYVFHQESGIDPERRPSNSFSSTISMAKDSLPRPAGRGSQSLIRPMKPTRPALKRGRNDWLSGQAAGVALSVLCSFCAHLLPTPQHSSQFVDLTEPFAGMNGPECCGVCPSELG